MSHIVGATYRKKVAIGKIGVVRCMEADPKKYLWIQSDGFVDIPRYAPNDNSHEQLVGWGWEFVPPKEALFDKLYERMITSSEELPPSQQS